MGSLAVAVATMRWALRKSLPRRSRLTSFLRCHSSARTCSRRCSSSQSRSSSMAVLTFCKPASKSSVSRMKVQFSFRMLSGVVLGSTSRRTMGMIRLLFSAARPISTLHTSDAIESGLMRKRKASASSMPRKICSSQSTAGGMDSQSTHTSCPIDLKDWISFRAATKSRLE